MRVKTVNTFWSNFSHFCFSFFILIAKQLLKTLKFKLPKTGRSARVWNKNFRRNLAFQSTRFSPKLLRTFRGSPEAFVVDRTFQKISPTCWSSWNSRRKLLIKLFTREKSRNWKMKAKPTVIHPHTRRSLHEKFIILFFIIFQLLLMLT